MANAKKKIKQLIKAIIYILAAIGLFAFAFILITVAKLHKMSKVKIDTRFKEVDQVYSNLDSLKNVPNFFDLLEKDYESKFYNEVRNKIGDSNLQLMDRIVAIYLFPDQRNFILYYDYCFPCNTCPEIPLWRLNVFFTNKTFIPRGLEYSPVPWERNIYRKEVRIND